MFELTNFQTHSEFRWTVLFLALPMLSSAFFLSDNHISDPDFPYEFWKPTSIVDTVAAPSETVKSSSKKEYGFFYGKPMSSRLEADPDAWSILPIKIPKDVVGEVKEKSTRNPLKDLTTHPSSLIPQYGRHPGATEAPPLFFPQKLSGESLIKETDRRSIASPFHSKRKMKPKLKMWKFKKQPQHPRDFSPSSAIRRHPIKSRGDELWTPSNSIGVISIDRTVDPPPHAFYPIKNSPDLKIGILHKNETHSTYLSPQEYKRKIKTLKTRGHTRKRPHFPPKKYNILDYSRYELNKGHIPTKLSRKHFNENLINLIKKKVERKPPMPKVSKPSSYFDDSSIFLDEMDTRNAPIWTDKHNQYRPNLRPQARQPIVSSYSSINSTDIVRRPVIRNPFRNKPDRFNLKPDIKYSTRNPNPPPVSYNVESKLTSRLKNLFNSALNLNAKPNYSPLKPKVHPTKSPKHYLYYYHQNKVDKIPYKPHRNSLIDRITSIHSAPASIVVPGGLAALGLGLAFYYFNYVWYPTPVVEARLSQLLETVFPDYNKEKNGQNEDIGKILEAFRGIEAAELSQDLTSDSCRNRLVCELHHDIPKLWEVTQVISTLLSSQLSENSEYEKTLKTYLETAKQGTDLHQSCKSIFDNCELSYLPVKSLFHLLLQHSPETETYTTNHGESRVL